MTKTIGISPKVLIPALGQVLIGGVLILVGAVVEGKTAIATGLGTLVVGFAAPPAPTITVGTEDPGEPTQPIDAGVRL